MLNLMAQKGTLNSNSHCALTTKTTRFGGESSVLQIDIYPRVLK